MDQTKRDLIEAGFAADELRLFLDTHPDECRALEAYRAAAERVKQCQKELTNAVCAMDAGKNGSWDWTCTPWPWEMED